MARKKRYKHIYFESKTPGRDSVFQAVRDIGKKGVNTRKEFIRLCLAQLSDLADYKTKDHNGNTISFTKQLWVRRTFVLRRLNKTKKFRLKKLVDYIDRVGRAYLDKKITAVELAEAIDKIAKKYGVSTKEAREIARKVVQTRKVLTIMIRHIDGRIEKIVFGKPVKISKKKRVEIARRIGRRVKKKLESRFDKETKQIARYLWSMIPDKYKKKPLRIWYYVMCLWLAYYIRKWSREKGIDWRSFDWASEIDWKQGYKHAKRFVENILRTGLSKYEAWTTKDYEEYDKYIEQMMQWERQRLAETIA